MEDSLPCKMVKLRNTDKRFFTNELKVIDRQSKREYRKHGKSLKFFNLKENFRQLYKKASKGYLRKNVEELLNSKPGQAHNTLRKMGSRPLED